MLTNYGKSDRKRIQRLTELLPELAITHTIRPLDEAALEWFIPLYVERLSAKENPSPYDVKSSTLLNPTWSAFEMIEIREAGEIVGGLILLRHEKYVSVFYRTFPSQWNNVSKQLRVCGPALYTEYLLDSYAQSLGHTYLLHGSDRNPYGLNSAIGVCIFKLSIGCKPYMMKNEVEDRELNPTTLEKSALVMHPTEPGQRITEATLFVKPENLSKYEQLFTYAEILNVKVIEI